LKSECKTSPALPHNHNQKCNCHTTVNVKTYACRLFPWSVFVTVLARKKQQQPCCNHLKTNVPSKGKRWGCLLHAAAFFSVSADCIKNERALAQKGDGQGAAAAAGVLLLLSHQAAAA
jgi:hypothetical protein